MKNNTLNQILEQHYTGSEKAEVKYVLTSIKNDLTKVLILAFPFGFLGCLAPYLYATFVISVLRVFTGGFHFHTYLSCLLFSAFNYSVIIGLWTKLYSYSDTLILIAIPLSVVLILLSPMLTKEKQQAFNYEAYNRKKPAIIIAGLLLLNIYSANPLFIIGTLSIIVLSLQNILMKGVQTYEENH